jgi:hypothetical protein
MSPEGQACLAPRSGLDLPPKWLAGQDALEGQLSPEEILYVHPRNDATAPPPDCAGHGQGTTGRVAEAKNQELTADSHGSVNSMRNDRISNVGHRLCVPVVCGATCHGRSESGVQIAPPRPIESESYGTFWLSRESAVVDFGDAKNFAVELTGTEGWPKQGGLEELGCRERAYTLHGGVS